MVLLCLKLRGAMFEVLITSMSFRYHPLSISFNSCLQFFVSVVVLYGFDVTCRLIHRWL